MRSEGVLYGVILAALVYLLWRDTQGSRTLSGIIAQGRADAQQLPTVDLSSLVTGQFSQDPMQLMSLPSWAPNDPNAPWNS